MRQSINQSINQSIGKLSLILIFISLLFACSMNVPKTQNLAFSVRIPSEKDFEIAKAKSAVSDLPADVSRNISRNTESDTVESFDVTVNIKPDKIINLSAKILDESNKIIRTQNETVSYNQTVQVEFRNLPLSKSKLKVVIDIVENNKVVFTGASEYFLLDVGTNEVAVALRPRAIYTFTDTVRKVGTTKITINDTETEYDIVEFGDFPQTIKDANVNIDETQSITRGAHTYYVGSDGNYYAKILENAWDSNYKYSDGTTVAQSSANSEKYFKVEPIRWRVLTKNYNNTNKALLLAENILTANVPFYEEWENERKIGDQTIYPNNYMHSQVRAYLNGLEYQGKEAKVSTHKGKGFLQTAFSEVVQDKIATTTVDNSLSSITGTGEEAIESCEYICDNTNDKIFLLSEKEVTTAEYGFDALDSYGEGNSRIRVTTDYAKANFAFQETMAGCGGCWWLRSPSYDYSYYARDVLADGSAYDYSDVNDTADGVVPALSIEY